MIGDYLKIPMSKDKRHFVFGDIHGKYEALIELLKEFDYDEKTDMLYSVGDMIDRGPQSVECFKFFTEQSNTWAIFGNHEYMMTDDEWFQIWVSNGGIYTDDSLREHGLDRTFMTKTITKMPMVLDVGENDDDDSFRLIHAEMPFFWDSDGLKINLSTMTREYLSQQLQWSRKTVTAMHTAMPEQVIEMAEGMTARNDRTVFSGHTFVKEVLLVGNQYFIDTGANKLTAINAITKEVHSVNIHYDYL